MPALFLSSLPSPVELTTPIALQRLAMVLTNLDLRRMVLLV
jgi:hypothetical protein